jgi:GGDEF domain-containing protein
VIDSLLSMMREPVLVSLEPEPEPETGPSRVSIELTVSAGTAMFSGQSIDDTLRECDVALYAAKGPRPRSAGLLWR